MKYVIVNGRGEAIERNLNARDASIKILTQNDRKYQIIIRQDNKIQLYIESNGTNVPATDGKGCHIIASTYDMFWHEVATRFAYNDLMMYSMTEHLYNVMTSASSQFRS